MSHIFHPTSLREYDIRGIVGKTLSEADAYAIGRSIATLVRRGGGASVAVGRDGRESSPVLERELVRGLTESGADVVRIGLGPTPMLYYAAAVLEVDAGVMITGSHNPADYNGFKMVLAGRAFFGADIQNLGRMAAAGDWEAGAGAVRDEAMLDRYVDRLLLRIMTAAPSGSAGTPATARRVPRWRSWRRNCPASIICSTPTSTAAFPTTIPTRPRRRTSPI